MGTFLHICLPENFMCLAREVESLNFRGSVWRGNPHRGRPIFCCVWFIFDIHPIAKFDPSSFNGLKVQNFGGPDCGGSSQPGTLDFCRTKVLPDIFNRSNFTYSAVSGLKVDSGRRKSKKKDAKQEK